MANQEWEAKHEKHLAELRVETRLRVLNEGRKEELHRLLDTIISYICDNRNTKDIRERFALSERNQYESNIRQLQTIELRNYFLGCEEVARRSELLRR